MSVPKSVVKIKKDSVEYIEHVDYAKFAIKELIRAALRDSGKFICKRFRQAYYARFKRRKGKVGRFTQYWVRKNQEIPDLLVGIKPNAFYGGFQEVGTSKTNRYGLLFNTVKDNIGEIRKIQGQYLSALNEDSPNIEENDDYEGGADG